VFGVGSAAGGSLGSRTGLPTRPFSPGGEPVDAEVLAGPTNPSELHAPPFVVIEPNFVLFFFIGCRHELSKPATSERSALRIELHMLQVRNSELPL
jgi:hypothetical protein